MRNTRRMGLLLASGFTVLGVAGIMVWSYSPDGAATEIVVLGLLSFGTWLILKTFADKKTATLISVGIVCGLIMNRLGILEPLTLLLMFVVLIGLGSI